MEALVVEDEGNDEIKEVVNPVIYKLARVDGDGRLVAATDDEIVEVEDMLDDDKNEMNPVTEAGQDVGCVSNNEFTSSNIQFKGLEGQSEDLEVDAEKLIAQLDAGVALGKSNAQPEVSVPSLLTNSNDSLIDHSGSGGEWSNSSDGPIQSGSSTSAVCTSSKPDFSKLKGEICLDNLSVRELHETFKAAFGRETSVKDKQWLKRRIAMGLTNSCDISTMTFVIEDNKVLKKGEEEYLKCVNSTLVKDLVVGTENENHGGSPIGCNNQTANPQILRDPSLEYDCSNDDLRTPQTAAKRVRKPTKRYIEELSEVESREYTGKLISSVKNSGHGQASPTSYVRAVRHAPSDGRPVVTRQDSLGGSGIQVPYVCRVRRSRPREDFMALMKLQPNSMGMAAKLVKKALGECDSQLDNEIGNKDFKARFAAGWFHKPLLPEPEKDEHYLETKASVLEKDVEMKHMDSTGDHSDDYTVTMPTEKDGMRRKHHRPWTLSEVVKLVEGVAKYGAGRWSEIKRLSFASYSYRTSVDLKDKWRNLLRASFAQAPAEKGVQNSRKHASAPIPAPILLRVRELAEMQAQLPPNLSFSKFAASSGRNVHETSSGYL